VDVDHWVCGLKSIKGQTLIALLLEACSALVQVDNPGLAVLYEKKEIQYLWHKFRSVASRDTILPYSPLPPEPGQSGF
jgi:hypothetical protein